MPDIDMDFDERRRDEVIRYATEKYGADHVAQIVTFQTIKGKQGIRDAARVLGFPPVVGDRLCKMYPPAVMGRDYPIEDALELSPDLANAYEREPEAKEIVETARALEGLRREDSVHAAGVVIGDAPLVNYLPAQALEGLPRRLEEGRDAVRHERRRGPRPAEDGLPRTSQSLGDRGHAPASARARASTSTSTTCRSTTPRRTRCCSAPRRPACSRWSRPGMRNLIKLLDARPLRGSDGARGALPTRAAEQRPAHRVRRAQARSAEGDLPHPDLEPILRDTYGVMIYQEQIMQIAVTIAGYSMGQADTLRKVMAKKKRESSCGAEREQFVAGCRRPGPSRAARQGAVRPDRALRRLRVPGRPRLRLRLHRLPDRVPDGAPPGRVHGGDPHVGQGRQGSQAVLPLRVPRHGHRGAAARRERVRDRLRTGARRRTRDPLRALGGAQRRRGGRHAASSTRVAREGAFTSFSDFCRKVDPGVLTKRVLESLVAGGRVRLPRVHAAGAAARPRTRCRDRSSPSGRRRRPGSSRCSAVRGGRRRARETIDESVLRGRGVRQAHAAAPREGDARTVRDRSPAARDPRRPRGASAPTRSPTSSRSATATSSRSAASSARSPASTRSAASRTRSSGSRGWPAASTSSRSRACTRRCPA